jgi:EAL domain-containing protein (putative c-di-GMP-specific phosphodiesterase class I)
MDHGPHYSRLDCNDCGKFVKWGKKPASMIPVEPENTKESNKYTGGFGMNNVSLVGRLTKDPELRYTSTNNTAVCGFTIAVNRRIKQDGQPEADFIAIAEEDGMIIEIGRIVTELVLKQMYDWKEKGLVLKPVSINFSTIQIQDHEYKEFLLEKLEKYEIDPKLIVIEITESIFLENKETTIVFLNELRSYGIKIAVDDFGTGYSSLSYLTFLPIDAIKLDRTLNIKFLELENISVMDSLISLAHSLNLKVVAEGIEEKEQVKRLIVGKCDVIQGFYFCGPLEAEDVKINYNKIYN